MADVPKPRRRVAFNASIIDVRAKRTKDGRVVQVTLQADYELPRVEGLTEGLMNREGFAGVTIEFTLQDPFEGREDQAEFNFSTESG